MNNYLFQKEIILNNEKYFVGYLINQRKKYGLYSLTFKDDQFVISGKRKIKEEDFLELIKIFSKVFPKTLENHYKKLIISNGVRSFFLGEPLTIKNNLIYFNDKVSTFDSFYDDHYDLIKDTLYQLFLEEVKRIARHPSYNFDVKKVKTYYGINYVKKHKIILNIYLIHFSRDIIKSVIDHELIHDFYRNHQENFYQKLLEVNPNYYELDYKLKKGIIK